jgi:predicted DCC family thiol-disulfide oxidoreductase YuxK
MLLDCDPTLAPATADADRGHAAFTRTGLALYDLLVLRGLCPSAPYSYRSDPRVPPFPDDRPIFIFDAHCVLCSRWVELVLRYDRAGRYRLLSAQSAPGRALYVHYGLDPENYETNILLIDGVALIKAEGSIRLAVGLGLPWSLAGILRVLPRRLADVLYEWVARNRFRMFGRRETCYLPRTVDQDRFIA